MTYTQIMQKAGKKINRTLFYYNGNTRVDIDKDDVPTITKYFKAALVGTVMKGLSVESKIQLPVNKPIYFTNTASYGSNSATKEFGPFYLKEEPKYDASAKLYEYEFCDNFLTSMVDYTPITITYPTTVLAFFQRLVIESGFTTNINSLPNGSRIIDHDIYEGIGFTRRDVFDDIAQATGSRFIMDGSVVKKGNLSTTKITINDDILKNQNIELGEHYGPINSVILSRSGDSDKIYKRDEEANSWSEFEIRDNQLMNDNNRSDYLDELYSALYGIEYDIMDLELVGYGGFEPFDLVEIQTKKDNSTLVYDSYVLNDEEEFTQGYKEVIYSDLQEGSNTDYKTSDTTDKRINQAYIIVNKQQVQIEALTTKVETVEGNEGNHYQELLDKYQAVDDQLADIDDIEYTVRQIQTDTYTKTEIQQIANGTGVNGVKVSAVISESGTFDIDGMTYEKTGAPTKTTINEVGINTKDNDNKSLLFAGYVDENNTDYADYVNQTIVGTDNIIVRNYLNVGEHSRIQDYGNGSGIFVR